MHAYFITRGRGMFVRRFIENLEQIFLPYNKKYHLQLIPRPIQLWELAFPEEHKDKILNILGDDTPAKISKKGEHKGSLKWVIILRDKLVKMMGLMPIPKNIKGEKAPRPNIAVHMIGLKKDWFKDGVEQI